MRNRVSLSKSNLWQRQRQYYEQKGIAAWNWGVPYYATGNPNIANSYANIIITYIREIKKQTTTVQESSPVYIVELGTGPGVFSFYMVKRLCELAESLKIDKKSFVYVMTDMVESNIEYWCRQSVFKDYISQGVLDFAKFDLERDTDISLKNSGVSIAEKACCPAIFIANYVFDTLTQDVFEINEGGIKEGLVKLDPKIGEVQPNQWNMLNDIDGGLTYQPVELPYYHDPALDSLLSYYQNKYQNCFLTIPIGTIEAIKRLRSIAQDRLLLLSTDKAYSQHFEYCGQVPPDLVFHDQCFSMTVNFDAIGRYFETLGGDCYHQDTQQSIITSAFMFGGQFQELAGTVQALHDYLGSYGPGNLLTLNSIGETIRFECNLEQIIAALSISHWDPWIFNSYFDAIFQQVQSPNLTKSAIYDLCNSMKKIADNVYYIPGQADTFANIGLVFQTICNYEEALVYYQKSLACVGKVDAILYNMALCYMFLNEMDQALQMFAETVTVNPNYIMAKGWIVHIKQNQNVINNEVKNISDVVDEMLVCS